LFPGEVIREKDCQRQLQEYEAAVAPAQNDLSVCGVCGTFHSEIVIWQEKQLAVYAQYLQRPSVYEHIPENMICTPKSGSLKGTILEPEGLNTSEEGHITSAQLCHSCRNALLKRKTPSLAYANEMWSRPKILPLELRDLTWLEWKLISPSRPCVTVIRLVSHTGDITSQQRGYKASCVSYPQPVQTLQTVLPVRPTGVLDFLRVVFTGKDRVNWKRNTFRMLGVRTKHIKTALQYLQKYNPFYANVELDDHALNEYDRVNLEDLIVDQMDDVEGIDTAEHDTYAKNQEDEAFPEEGLDIEINGIIDTTGATHQHNQIALSALSLLKGNSELSTPFQQEPYMNPPDRNHSIETSYMPRSDQPHNEYEDTDFIARSYPELYPFGVGYPGAAREVLVSLNQHLQFALMHCSRSFSKHSTFMFHVFNVIQRRKSCFSARLQTKRKDYDRVCAKLKDVKYQDLEAALSQEPSDYSDKIKLLLDKIYSVGSYIQGSPAALREPRKEIQAMITRFGPPHFFITLNPADLHHPLFLHFAGEKIDLKNLLFSSVTYRTRILAANPVAQALFFDKVIRSIFEILFGYKCAEGKGVLGKTRGFYGVYEAQGRGSLHLHGLVWLRERLHIPSLRQMILEPETQRKIIALLERSVCQNVEDTELSYDGPETCSHFVRQQLSLENLTPSSEANCW